MEKELIFHVLGLEETKDEDVIRNAYRTALKEVNPEDDPEGFKRLRQAYEEALEFCRQNEEDTEDTPKNEVDRWIDRVDAFYQDILSRHNVNEWKKRLTDPVCEELDTALEAREKLLDFLMTHIRLPHSVWKLIDELFEIRENVEELSQRFPMDFLNFITYYMENDTFLPYEYLTCLNEDKKPVNGDAYIDGYLAVKRKIDEKAEDTETLLKELDDLAAFHLYHPYEDAERIRLLIRLQKPEEYLPLCQKLTDDFPYNAYLWLYAGEGNWEAGKKEEAYAIWTAILQKDPDHYMAKYHVALYEMEKGEFYPARDKLLDLLEAGGQNKELTDALEKANEALIIQVRELLEKGETAWDLSEDELKLKLGLFLMQNERLEEAAEWMAALTPIPGRLEYQYYNVYGRVLYGLEDYEKALPLLQKRLELAEAALDDTEEAKRIHSRIGDCYYLLGGCYYAMERIKEAEEAMKLAVEKELNMREKLNHMRYLANLYLWTQEYEKSVDVCDKIVKEDDQYYPAYLIRQEAFFKLKKAQQVVNDYHNAIDIFPGYYRPYLYAAEVFFYYGQFEDGKNVIDTAKENHVEFSSKLKLFEAKILRNLAQGNEDRKQPHKLLEELLPELEKEECDLEDKSEVEYEMGLLYWDDDDFEPALKHLEKAIQQNEKRLQYRLIRGHVYLEMDQYVRALAEYKAAEPQYDDSAELYYNRGLCYEGLDEEEKAMENFEKASVIEPGYRKAYEKLSDYYKEKYDRLCRREDYEKAVSYIDKQLAVKENGYYLVCRGLIHNQAMETERAIQDYQKALEYMPDDSIVWNNMACSYQSVRQFEKAIECLVKALESGKDKEKLPYRNMASCCWAVGRYEEALEWYHKALALWPDYTYLWKKLGDAYYDLNEFDKALEAYEHTKERSDHYKDISDVWMKQGNMQKAIWYCKKGIKTAEDGEKAEHYSNLGDLYMEMMMDYEKAIDCYQTASDLESDPAQRFYYEAYLARCYVMMGKKRNAKKHGEAALKCLKESGRTLEDHLAYRAYGTARLANIGWIYLAIGETKQGLACFREMQTSQPCKNCSHKGCFESYLYLGRFYESLKAYDKALKELEKAHEMNPFSVEVVRAMEFIQKKQKKQKQ